MSLTQDGQTFFRYCAELLLLAKQAEASTQPKDDELQASLKICAPVGIGERLLLPLIGEFHKAYPKLRLTLVLDDNLPNIAEQHIDVSIRTDRPDASQLSSIPLIEFEEYLIASPDYIAKHGMPLHPDTLHYHQWIVHSSNHLPRNYQVKNSLNDEFKIRITPFVSCNSTNALVNLVTQDLGIAILPNCVVRELLEQEKMIRLLPDYHLNSGTLYACHPYTEDTPPRVRVLIDFLKIHFQLN